MVNKSVVLAALCRQNQTAANILLLCLAVVQLTLDVTQKLGRVKSTLHDSSQAARQLPGCTEPNMLVKAICFNLSVVVHASKVFRKQVGSAGKKMLAGRLRFDDVPVRMWTVDSQSVQKRSGRPRDVW